MASTIHELQSHEVGEIEFIKTRPSLAVRLIPRVHLTERSAITRTERDLTTTIEDAKRHLWPNRSTENAADPEYLQALVDAGKGQVTCWTAGESSQGWISARCTANGQEPRYSEVEQWARYR